MTESAALIALAQRIADALDRLAPPAAAKNDLNAANAFVWQPEGEILLPVPDVAHVDLPILAGIESQRDQLLANTKRFAQGHMANNALLWGARGMGKSSLVKAIHAAINETLQDSNRLVLVEIHREDLPTLPTLLRQLRTSSRRFILFCDDLSFDSGDATYKSLKAVLEGGIEGRPANVIFYATSNRRHLMPRDMIENERATAINPGEAVEEKVSLSDRFGLWLGFHVCDQETYFTMVDRYAAQLGLAITTETLHARAREWAITRGNRSGRVAWQFIQDLAGELASR